MHDRSFGSEGLNPTVYFAGFRDMVVEYFPRTVKIDRRADISQFSLAWMVVLVKGSHGQNQPCSALLNIWMRRTRLYSNSRRRSDCDIVYQS